MTRYITASVPCPLSDTGPDFGHQLGFLDEAVGADVLAAESLLTVVPEHNATSRRVEHCYRFWTAVAARDARRKDHGSAGTFGNRSSGSPSSLPSSTTSASERLLTVMSPP